RESGVGPPQRVAGYSTPDESVAPRRRVTSRPLLHGLMGLRLARLRREPRVRRAGARPRRARPGRRGGPPLPSVDALAGPMGSATYDALRGDLTVESAGRPTGSRDGSRPVNARKAPSATAIA